MSVPSPKAEPLKQWLAQVGIERIEETEDPELKTHVTHALYRIRTLCHACSLMVRNALTALRQNRASKISYGRSFIFALLAQK